MNRNVIEHAIIMTNEYYGMDEELEPTIQTPKKMKTQ